MRQEYRQAKRCPISEQGVRAGSRRCRWDGPGKHDVPGELGRGSGRVSVHDRLGGTVRVRWRTFSGHWLPSIRGDDDDFAGAGDVDNDAAIGRDDRVVKATY
jgi:hypothetical protein